MITPANFVPLIFLTASAKTFRGLFVKAGVIKRNGKCFIPLPDAFLDEEEIELFQLRDGYYLLSPVLGAKQKAPAKSAPESSGPTEQEKAVLKKLMAIKFESRTPKYVSQSFTSDEKTILEILERKGYVNVFKGGKYKETGVYNISDIVYPMLKDNPNPPKAATTTSPPANSTLAELFKTGFILLSNNNEAANFSEVLRKEGKNNDVLGIKSFDGKYYIVTKKYFTELVYNIKNVLKEDLSLSAIAQACKEDEIGCRGVLLLMAERGDVVEKRKGLFALV